VWPPSRDYQWNFKKSLQNLNSGELQSPGPDNDAHEDRSFPHLPYLKAIALRCAASIIRAFENYPTGKITMPIYAYRCSSCGLLKDVMQKMNEAPLSTCPQCGKATFAKQLTAAGFQLKGSGYYVTDFKGGPKRQEPGKPGEVKTETKTEASAAPANSASPSVTGSST
jgi:putative FmdB family regulatory protein